MDVRVDLVLIGWCVRVDRGQEQSAVRVTRQLPNMTDSQTSSFHSHNPHQLVFLRLIFHETFSVQNILLITWEVTKDPRHRKAVRAKPPRQCWCFHPFSFLAHAQPHRLHLSYRAMKSLLLSASDQHPRKRSTASLNTGYQWWTPHLRRYPSRLNQQPTSLTKSLKQTQEY